MKKLFLVLCLILIPIAAYGRHRACCVIYEVKVMELYTPEAAAINGGETSMGNIINQGITDLRISLANSGVGNVVITLVYTGVTPFSQGSMSQAEILSRMRADDVSALRNQYGADLVGVWSNSMDGSFADVPVPGVTGDTFAYHIIAANPIFQNYWRTIYPHELGHNLGMNHEDGY